MNPTFPVSSGLLDPKHRRQMGMYVWLYLWCVNRQTDGEGNVLGGRRLIRSMVSKDLEISTDSVTRGLARLQRHGYIQVRRLEHSGFSLLVTNEKKFSWIRARRKSAEQPAAEVRAQVSKSAEQPAAEVPSNKGRDLGSSSDLLVPEQSVLEKRHAGLTLIKPSPNNDPKGNVTFDPAEILELVRGLGKRMPDCRQMTEPEREARIAELRHQTEGWRA